MPLLTEDEATELIESVGGSAVSAYSWPSSLRDAIRRPLFALLLGAFIQEGRDRGIPSTGELLANLVERALGRLQADAASSNELLRKLAVGIVMNRGASLAARDFASRNEVASLLDTRLVVEEDDRLRFTLPILVEWFAAHSLVAGNPLLEDILGDENKLEPWRHSLLILASTFGHDDVSRIMDPVARRHPAFAATIVEGALPGWRAGQGSPLPSTAECKRRLRLTMEAWVAGIKELASVVAPVDEDGRLGTLAVSAQGEWLSTMWRHDANSDAGVVETEWPGGGLDQLGIRGWREFRSGVPGTQPAWAWRWSLDDLRGNLRRVMEARALPVDDPGLREEADWTMALELTGRGSLWRDPVPASEVEPRLADLPRDGMLISRGKVFNVAELRSLRRRLHDSGLLLMSPPLPPPDLETGGGWVWEPYSNERLMERVRAAYSKALEAYSRAAETILAPLAPRLPIAATLPARLVGVVRRPPTEGLASHPSLEWWMEPLPLGAESAVDLEFTESESESAIRFDQWGQRHAQIVESIRRLRPRASAWLTPVLEGTALEIFHARPVRELVYELLWRDLHQAAWIESSLFSRKNR